MASLGDAHKIRFRYFVTYKLLSVIAYLKAHKIPSSLILCSALAELFEYRSINHVRIIIKFLMLIPLQMFEVPMSGIVVASKPHSRKLP
jgi:hypothetical protein